MSKTTEEITAEILSAALAAKAITTTGTGTTQQAIEIASAYKTIREAVLSEPPPGP